MHRLHKVSGGLMAMRSHGVAGPVLGAVLQGLSGLEPVSSGWLAGPRMENQCMVVTLGEDWNTFTKALKGSLDFGPV